LVDIDPADTASKYTPREATLVDAVAEAKRIADQQMRSNPLKDARVNSGLTKWTGNYGGDLAWIGEFYPADKNQFDQYGNQKPQRGINFVRDDPQHNIAFALYDPWPTVGVPLRQRIYMYDADGKAFLKEGYSGGRAFPDAPIVLYQREVIDPNGITIGSDVVVFSGEGNLIGSKVQMSAAWAAIAGTPTWSTYLRLTGGGVTINTATTSGSGGSNISWTVDVKTIMNVSDYINVEWHMWKTGGTGGFTPRPYFCRMYSDANPS
jgi:hypothetical protein